MYSWNISTDGKWERKQHIESIFFHERKHSFTSIYILEQNKFIAFFLSVFPDKNFHKTNIYSLRTETETRGEIWNREELCRGI